MKTLLSVLPEILFGIGAAVVVTGMWSLMGFMYALIFTGAVLILASNYLHEIMHVEVADE